MSEWVFVRYPLTAVGCRGYFAIGVYLSPIATACGEYNYPAPPAQVCRLGLPFKQSSFIPHSQRFTLPFSMAMKMLLIQMSADGAFKPLCKKTAGKFTADLKALFWRHLFGGETLDNVITEHTTVFRFLPSAFSGLHGRKSSGRITVESGHIQLIFGFFVVLGVTQKALRVFGLNDFGFLWIGGIGKAAVQIAAYGYDFCIGHFKNKSRRTKGTAARIRD